GLGHGVLRRLGRDPNDPGHVSWQGLGPFDRGEIDAIVTSHGVINEDFRLLVIRLAQGNPLIAHIAASLAVDQGVFTGADVIKVLRRHLRSRLAPLGDEHAAVATAVALLTSAEDATAIVPLASVLTGLPADPSRIQTIVDDLLDAAALSGPPLVVRPDLVAPVLVADALLYGDHNEARSRRPALDVRAAIGYLVVEAQPRPPLRDLLPEPGLLGAPARLAGQLAVVAQAAEIAGDGTARAAVRTALIGLAPEAGSQNTAGRWKNVFEVARQVAPFLPALVDDLAGMLAAAWPVASSRLPLSSMVQTGDEVVLAAAEAAEAAAGPDEESVTYAALALFTLCGLDLATTEHSPWRTPAASLARLAGPPAFSTEAAVARRRTLLAVLDERWRCSSFASAQDRERVARALLQAAQALGSPVMEHRRLGTVENAMEMSLRAPALPADDATRQVLQSVVGLAIHVLDGLHGDGLRDFVAAMEELRAAARRGLPFAGGPFDPQLVVLVDEAVDQLEAALARRWDSLPLLVRRAAALVLLEMPRGGTYRSLRAQSEAGSPLAAVAVADERLNRLLMLFPLDITHAEDLEEEQRHQVQAATVLAEQIEVADAEGLLDDAATDALPSWNTGPLRAFAIGLGRRLGSGPSLQVVLRRLRREVTAGAGVWLPALTEGALTDPADMAGWVERISGVGGPQGVAAVLLPALDAMRGDSEHVLLSALLQQAL
ncbi:MAG TPA: hypothetical protein VF153_01590, partial [Candidatus Limnocylindria bacterium]